ncbi:MAG: amidohydrolase family protein, partial [Proteobacteria bacterium]|nr:amidohydrolase family protein [Pseudomonadota bacterium]
MKYIYLITILLSFNLSSATVIYSSSYVDVVNQNINKNYSITIEDNQITSINKGFIKLKDGDSLIDLRGMTVMPGLMDMHVHFGQEYQSKADRPSKIEKETSAILASKHALITLKSGFTTV